MEPGYGAVAASPRAAAGGARGGRTRAWWVDGLALVSLALLTTGSHYAKHSLAGLGGAVMSALGVARLEFGLLFALQQVPGVLLPVAGGLCLTFLPLAPAAVALTAVLAGAGALCAGAVDARSYRALLAGRFAFGVADGLLTTVAGALIARRFRREQVALAFGAMLLASRASSFAGFALPPVLLERFSLSAAMWASAATMAVPVAAALTHAALDRRFPPAAAAARAPARVTRAAVARALRALTLPFWAIAYTFMTVAASTFSFLHFAPDFFGETIGLTAVLSSLLSGLLFLCAGLMSPVVGLVADRVGRRAQQLIVSAAATTAGIAVCAAIALEPRLGVGAAHVGLLLLAFSLCVAPVVLLSCVAILVEPAVLPLALGAYKSTENAGVAVVHVVIGGLRDYSGTYFLALAFVAAVAMSSLPPLLYLLRAAPELNLSARQLHEVEDEGEAEALSKA